MARWRAANPELAKERQRQFKADHPDTVKVYRRRFAEKYPEKKREWDRLHREKNAEHLARLKAEHYAINADQVRARTRAWRIANPERYREIKQRRRARVAGATVGPIDVASLWTGFCGICAEPIDPELRRPDLMSRSIDHITPLSRGGEHTQSNLQWTHLLCNLRKGKKVP